MELAVYMANTFERGKEEMGRLAKIIGFGIAAFLSLILTIGCIWWGDANGAICAASSTVGALTISIIEATP